MEASPADRLLAAFDLWEAGVAMMRQNLLRRHPTESEAEIDVRLAAWMAERKGAEQGDGIGRPGRWPRTPRE